MSIIISCYLLIGLVITIHGLYVSRQALHFGFNLIIACIIVTLFFPFLIGLEAVLKTVDNICETMCKDLVVFSMLLTAIIILMIVALNIIMAVI